MRPRRIVFRLVIPLVLLLAIGAASAVALVGHHRRAKSAHAASVRRVAAAVSAPTSQSISCPAPALGGQLPADVYLPAGYNGTTTRFPVVYFLHGLPANPDTYTEYGFVARAVARGANRAIVVAPQGARRPDSDQEYLDWSATDDWPKAIVDQLVSCIDSRYRTIADRNGRALVGLSAGGYGAFDIGLRNLATFAAVESWSGYFVATDPSGYHVLKFRTAAAREAATVPRGQALAAELAQSPSLIAFYVGSSDERFRDDNVAFDKTLSRSHLPHVFRVYPGSHTIALWERHVSAWLGMALVYLRSGRVVAP